MPNVILIPCRSRQGRFRRSVVNGVPHNGLRAYGLEPQSLRMPARGPLRSWGLGQGKANERIWNDAEPGDTVIFTSGHQILASASVFSLVESEELARLVWKPTKREPLCPRMLILVDPSFGETPFAPVGRALGLKTPPRSATAVSAHIKPAAVFEAEPEQEVLTGPGPIEDEMTTWHRQGLLGRSVALQAARNALEKGEGGAEDSIRRVVRALAGPRTQHRFPAVAQVAEEVQAAQGAAFEAATKRLLGAIHEVTNSADDHPIRIMIVEDDPLQAHLTREIVSGPGRQVLNAASVEEAERLLGEQDMSLIILDLGMPGADGRELLIRLRESPRTSGTPIVMLSGKEGAQPRTECLALGADAFYSKRVEPATLAAAVSVMMERAAEARYLAHRDPLTGLINRAAFLEASERQRLASLRSGELWSFVLLDLDGFQALNDAWSSTVGDQALMAVADQLTALARQSDLVTRWGGDEFAVLLLGTGAEGIARFLEKLNDAMKAVRIPGRPKLRITCSAGAVEVVAGDTVAEAVVQATRRLHIAKRAGGSASVSDDRELAPAMRTVLVVEDDLITSDLVAHRLKRDGFEVMQFANGAEALARAKDLLAALVVLDTTLPGASGFEVLRQLRLTPTYSHVPVLMLTSGRAQEVARALELGATDALAKPFDTRELTARVSALVKRRPTRRGA